MMRGQSNGAMPKSTLRLPGQRCVMGGMRRATAAWDSASSRPSRRLAIPSVALARSHSMSQSAWDEWAAHKTAAVCKHWNLRRACV